MRKLKGYSINRLRAHGCAKTLSVCCKLKVGQEKNISSLQVFIMNLSQIKFKLNKVYQPM